MNNLSDMKKDQPFKVPEDYFENLSDRISERIEQEENPKEKNLVQVLKPYMWMAASIIGFVFVAKLILTTSVPTDFQNQQITQIEDTSTVSTENTDSEIFFDSMSETSTDEIIEYLSDYDIATDELLANL
ncbi:hypothetical protein [Marinifilum caeruleilacunae]|uniref:Uncharacterized protein n=1 Tax=Marinifilum caeruleilacunae TaxID=2499076 RepID=A0ABX1WWU7_9BACT|nr:hypothetical protein [Marinifilum caeruleilacunae]NOU60527.1 hypothetical protein [Marinifilum caeruleilacunae]